MLCRIDAFLTCLLSSSILTKLQVSCNLYTCRLQCTDQKSCQLSIIYWMCVLFRSPWERQNLLANFMSAEDYALPQGCAQYLIAGEKMLPLYCDYQKASMKTANELFWKLFFLYIIKCTSNNSIIMLHRKFCASNILYFCFQLKLPCII